MLTDVLLYRTRNNMTRRDCNDGHEVASANNEVASVIILLAFDAEFPRSRGRDRAVFHARFTIKIDIVNH